MKVFLRACLFLFLTILTQVGGIIYLLNTLLTHFLKLKTRVKRLLLFVALYSLTTVLIIPPIAKHFGRVPLPVNDPYLKPLNILTCVLNRQYVKPNLREQLVISAKQMTENYHGTVTHYLDANFPFYNGFPLFPHLSHNDGSKIDLAFYYVDSESSEKVSKTPSYIGYGVFDGPNKGEPDYPKKCLEEGFWQYQFIKYLVPQWNRQKYIVDSERTRNLLLLLLKEQNTSKIFIEPHLKKRWKLSNFDKIRYHGCHAVRHDDHIHLQID